MALAGIVGVLMPLLLLISFHNRRLRREIAARLAVQAALKESETEFRTLVQSVRSVILRMTPEGNINFINAFGERFFGYTAAELHGKNLVGTIVPERESSGRDLRALIADLAKNPEKYESNENENITRDGRTVWVAWTNCPILDESGELSEVLCVGNDVTAVREAADSLRRYDFIVNTVKEMMSVINAQGCYEAVNDEWCAATGIARKAALGQPLAAVWPERVVRESILPRLERCFNGETVCYESPLQLAAIGERHCSVTMYPYRGTGGQITHAIVVAQDITKRKETEAALYEAMHAAEAGNRAKSTFLANMSHEIRTPLNAVLGYTQLLQRITNLTPDQAHALEAIRKSGDHLLTLINDVLELSRIEAGRVDFVMSTFSLEHFLADLELMFRVRTNAKGLSLSIVSEAALPTWIKADR